MYILCGSCYCVSCSRLVGPTIKLLQNFVTCTCNVYEGCLYVHVYNCILLLGGFSGLMVSVIDSCLKSRWFESQERPYLFPFPNKFLLSYKPKLRSQYMYSFLSSKSQTHKTYSHVYKTL